MEKRRSTLSEPTHFLDWNESPGNRRFFHDDSRLAYEGEGLWALRLRARPQSRRAAETLRSNPKDGLRNATALATREVNLDREAGRLEAQMAYLKNVSPEGGEALPKRENVLAIVELS